MKTRHFTAILLAATSLTACQNQGIDGQTGTDATKLLESMKGPEITGVDATMLKIAKNAEEQGDYRAAAQTYQQIMDKNPKNATLAISYAEALRRSGKADSALEIFNKVLAEHPDNQDAIEGKGLSELSLASLDAASVTLTKLNEINPNRWRTLNAIGILFATKNLYDESQQYFNAALEKNPNHPAILNNKGLVQALDRDFASALNSLLSAGKAAKTPQHLLRADLNAALVYAVAGDLNSAETMASKHLEGPALQNNLGLYALLAKDKDLARAHLNMALSESKMFYEKAWNNLDNVAQGNTAQTKSKEKRIQLLTDRAPLPELPKPNATTPAATSQTTTLPTLITKESQKPTANTLPTNLMPSKEAAAPAAPVIEQNVPTLNTEATPEESKPTTTPVDISANQTSINQDTTNQSATTEAPATGNIEKSNLTHKQAEAATTEPLKPSTDALQGFSFQSLFDRLKPATSVSTENQAAAPTLVAIEPTASETTPTTQSTEPAPTSTPEANNQTLISKPSEPVTLKPASQSTPATITNEDATKSPATKTSEDSEDKNTPPRVSDGTTSVTSGNTDISSEGKPMPHNTTHDQTNGFKALGEYITNW
jgi:Flp pilus assembly protein TadD